MVFSHPFTFLSFFLSFFSLPVSRTFSLHYRICSFFLLSPNVIPISSLTVSFSAVLNTHHDFSFSSTFARLSEKLPVLLLTLPASLLYFHRFLFSFHLKHSFACQQLKLFCHSFLQRHITAHTLCSSFLLRRCV